MGKLQNFLLKACEIGTSRFTYAFGYAIISLLLPSFMAQATCNASNTICSLKSLATIPIFPQINATGALMSLFWRAYNDIGLPIYDLGKKKII